MDILTHLIRLVTHKRNLNRIKNSIFDSNENKQRALFQAIKDNKVDNDAAAADLLYGCKPNEKRYLQLKNNLSKKIFNLLLQADPKVLFKNKFSRQSIILRKKLLIVQIMWLLNLRKDGVEILKVLIKEAEELNLTDIVINCARLLRYQSAFNEKKKDYNLYHKILNDAILKQQMECMVEHFKNDLLLKISKSQSERKDLESVSEKYYLKVKAISKDIASHNIKLEEFRITIRYYNIRRKYRKVMHTCNLFESFLVENPKISNNSLLFEVNANRVEACLYLLDYNNCMLYSDRCLRLVNPGTINWLVMREYQFLLAIQIFNLSEALQILGEVRAHPKFKFYSETKQEKWKLFEAYLLVILYERPILDSFRIAKLINEIAVYSHDKAGYNLSLAVIEIIYYLKIERYSIAEDKIDPLKIYLYRYIKKEENMRSYYFIKMLLLLPKYSFQKKKVEQIASKFLNKLKSDSYYIDDQIEVLEIVPYEKLWKIILSHLKFQESGVVHNNVKNLPERVN